MKLVCMSGLSTRHSAGILLFRMHSDTLEFFLGHMGGPFWQHKDERAWSIPKGEFDPENESPLDAAIREFQEETGIRLDGPFVELKPTMQRSGKLVFCWGCQGQLDPKAIQSNLFELEWPPKSGKMQSFPELDRGAWFSFDDAAKKIVKGQVPILEQLSQLMAEDAGLE